MTSPDDPRGAADAQLAEVRRALDDAHRHLLRIHKALIDYERIRYERAHDPVGGPVEFLRVLIHDPFFAWLRPMSALIAQIDEFTSSKDSPDPKDGNALIAETKRLLTPNDAGDTFA